jgi:hypothetical protein
MKTRILNLKMKCSQKLFGAMIVMLVVYSGAAQERDSIQTLFKQEIKVTEVWSPEIKINSIQGKIGTLVGFYGGALINRTFMVGLAGGVNLSHPTVNYGYFGGIGQVIFSPEKVVHGSGQLVVAFGTTKDYENPKKGLLDNFWNISGEQFFLMEPGFNLEINLSKRLMFVAGVSYRFVSGIDSDNENISKTRVSNKDMSGVDFSIGLKFGKQKKTK